MFRMLFLLAFLAWPISAFTDVGSRDPLTNSHEIAFTNAKRLSPLVEKRFTLFAAMTHCDYADNQYAYNLALNKFGRSERYILERAANAGWAAGAARDMAVGECEVAVDRLRTADNDLIARAELLPSP